MTRSALLLLATIALSAGCGGDDSEAAASLARPVTVLRLERTSPPPGRLLPGVVTPYRQTQIPFEVSGRVEELIDIGDEVQGEQTALDGRVVEAGTEMARIDDEPLQRALERARQRLASARLQLDAQVAQLDSVLPARLDSARSQAAAAELNASRARDEVEAVQAEVTLARTTYERNVELEPTGAVSDISVRQSEAELQAQESRLAQALTLVTTREREHDAALSAISELDGAIVQQTASNAAQGASVKELEAAVRDAESDLENCILRAPFPGRVTELHVGEGSFVQAGAPILTLTMMNPIEAVLSVSATLEEEVVVGTDALIYPMRDSEVDLESAVRATVFEKRGIADAGTRTFEIGLIAPNQRRTARSRAGLPSAPYVIPIFDNPLELLGGEGLYTVADAVAGEAPDHWVLRVRGLAQGARTAETLQGELQGERVPVRLGERTLQIASFRLVQLVGADDLNVGDLLVPEPTEAHLGGFVLDDNRWLLRPGDLVQVSVEQGVLPEGFYIPVSAVRERNGETAVFLLDDADRARFEPVEVAESLGELRRIESPRLEAGARIVASGVHFLQDGDEVVVTGDAQ
ncbi:MAG: HlyD family efflux transporter periplasmic adaptor subunit [Planctomycetota bacterium]